METNDASAPDAATFADAFHALLREPDYRGPATDSAFSEHLWNEACERLSATPALN